MVGGGVGVVVVEVVVVVVAGMAEGFRCLLRKFRR